MKKNIGTESLRFDKLSIVANHRIEVFVARCIGTTAVVGLPDSSCAVDERFLKSSAMRLVGFFVAKMPLAEDAGPVAGLLEYFCECFRLERHPFAFENGMRDSISHRMPRSHECRASGRAGGTDEKARQPRTLIVKLV